MKLWRVTVSGISGGMDAVIVVATSEDQAKERGIAAAQERWQKFRLDRWERGAYGKDAPRPEPIPREKFLPVRITVLCDDLSQEWAMTELDLRGFKGQLRKK